MNVEKKPEDMTRDELIEDRGFTHVFLATVIVAPFVTMMALPFLAFDALVLHQVWLWHFATIAAPWSTSSILIAMLVRQTLFGRLSKGDEKLGKSAVAKMFYKVAAGAIYSAIVLFIAWYAQ